MEQMLRRHFINKTFILYHLRLIHAKIFFWFCLHVVTTFHRKPIRYNVDTDLDVQTVARFARE